MKQLLLALVLLSASINSQALAGPDAAREMLLVETIKSLGFRNVQLIDNDAHCVEAGRKAICRVYQMQMVPYDAFSEQNIKSIASNMGGTIIAWKGYPGWFLLYYVADYAK